MRPARNSKRLTKHSRKKIDLHFEQGEAMQFSDEMVGNLDILEKTLSVES